MAIKRFLRSISVFIAAIMVCAVGDACAGSPGLVGTSGGCHEEIWEGVPGLVRPETSTLTCTAVKKLIKFRPSEPQSFLVSDELSKLRWKCQLYPAKGHSVLLRCTHHQKHFSVVKDTG